MSYNSDVVSGKLRTLVTRLWDAESRLGRVLPPISGMMGDLASTLDGILADVECARHKDILEGTTQEARSLKLLSLLQNTPQLDLKYKPYFEVSQDRGEVIPRDHTLWLTLKYLAMNPSALFCEEVDQKPSDKVSVCWEGAVIKILVEQPLFTTITSITVSGSVYQQRSVVTYKLTGETLPLNLTFSLDQLDGAISKALKTTGHDTTGLSYISNNDVTATLVTALGLDIDEPEMGYYYKTVVYNDRRYTLDWCAMSRVYNFNNPDTHNGILSTWLPELVELFKEAP